MTNFELLQAKIKDSGMTIVAICEKSGIERATFYNRINGKSEFTAKEVVELSEVLHLSKPDRDKIFLTKT